MDLVTKYIKNNSNGRKSPICGSTIAGAFGISGYEVRALINSARCNGDPICSNGKGYYIAADVNEVRKTVDSIKGRIHSMQKAVNGLEKYIDMKSA